MKESDRHRTSHQTTKDGGYGWIIVVSAFFIHFIVGGTIYTLGVLYTEFLQEFDQGKGNTAYLSSLPAGMMMLVGPIAGALTSRFGCRVVIITGAVITASSFVLSIFVKSIFLMYFLFGILPGVGFGFIILPTIVCVNRYFEKKRALAVGMAACGSGVGVFTIAPLLRFLLNKYGLRGTILTEAGICLNIVVFGAVLKPITYYNDNTNSKGKKGENKQTECRHDCSACLSGHFEFRLFKDPVFMIFAESNILSSLGYFAPYTYLPDRAELTEIDNSDSAFLISTIGITNLIGRLIFGWLADQRYVNRLLLYGVSMCICGVVNFLNPVDDNYEYLLAYAAILGMFNGVLISLNTVVLSDLIGLERLGKGLGLISGLRGTGVFMGPAITGWLYDGTGSYDASSYFVGLCMLLGGIVSLLIPVHQKMSAKRYKSQLDNNMNLETNTTKF